MIFLFYLALAQGQGTDIQQDTSLIDTFDIVEYQAKKIIYDIEKSMIILIDSSTFIYKDIRLTSDSAHYYIDSNILEAFGTCDLRQFDDSIKGDYLRYNIENKKAMMSHGITQIDKGFLDGDKIYWIDENTVNAYSGKYTTCSDTPPHYYFYSPKMKVYLGDMVIARPIVLYIHDIPVMAAPFWFVPISSQRKSGLLPFKIGNSRDFGKYIQGFAYYIVISDYADMTLQLDAMEKKGVMPHFEGVWDFSPFTKGSIYGSYIRETDSKSERYTLQSRNDSPYFLLGSSFNFNIKYMSDNSYQNEYADSIPLWLEQETNSQATLSRDIAGFKNSISYERNEKFADTMTISITEKLPFYTIAGPSKSLFSLISYSLSGHINRYKSSDSLVTNEVTGANIQTAPSMQQNLLNLFTISPRITLDLATFDKDTAGNTMPVRLGYSFETTANTNFYRVFNIQLFGIKSLLHKILPKVTYSYTPDFDFSRFPTVSGIPNFSKRNSITSGLNQIFEAKIGENEEKKILANLDLNTSYNLLTDSLSMINGRLQLPYNPFPKPITSFTNQLRGSLNPYDMDYTYTIENIIALKTDFFSLNLNQNYVKDGQYQVWFNGEVKPTRNWSMTYSARYDWDEKKLIDYGFGLSRNMHCWEAVFNFTQLGDIWRYDFKIRIKEIPDVEIGKGLLGYFLE
jgi:lipopolysaccharide assembly outer membrane protein LptD (OstA)